MPERVFDVLTREFSSFTALLNSPDWKAKQHTRKLELDAQALKYLRLKFPDTDDEVFCTDITGARHEHVIDAEEVCNAAKFEYACSHCKDNECLLPESFRNAKSRPVALIRENQAGVKYLCVRWTFSLKCANNDFMNMFKKSGLVQSQLTQTFSNYERVSGVSIAKAQALRAAEEHSCLILAGKAGTGKTHLAVAIALHAMYHGRQAYFRLVSELVDELREANKDNSDEYYALMKAYKEVPCLILDDMGKERTTAAGLDYVYQIVDYRYRHELQTIITTNAPDSETLSRWGSEEYIAPIISRIRGRGAWVTIAQAEDYRQKEREVKINARQK